MAGSPSRLFDLAVIGGGVNGCGIARDAADRGAEIRTRCRVSRLARTDGEWRIEAGGETFRARAVVSATGPAVLKLLGLADQPAVNSMWLVRGSHIVVPKLFDHSFAYFFQLPDERILFAIPYERDFTLIGTTDVDHEGRLDEVTASAEEVAYLCEGASRFFTTPVTPADVVWTFSGVRPLIGDGSGRPEAATRGYTLEMSDENEGPALLSVFGGKLTTYRQLAQHAVDKLKERVPSIDSGGWTDRSALPGGDLPVGSAEVKIAELTARYPFLERNWADRLLHAYGTTAWTILGDAASLNDCGEHLGQGLTQCEVDYLMAQEWACSKDDILWRRTKLGLHMSSVETAHLSEYLKEKAIA
ncbi:glycerol-3-phosphate dehydrogenase [Altererythrobacter sp. GH1-8]|uniref:glycerol-3-phosphate dehydrogenase n=1 Tax=Altererythrobacter sp. GH1-8 TaxID=3349333 RepID=UPI00374CD0EE